VRFGARDYDAFVGRWTTPEPLRSAAGDTNFYAYAFNDPVNLIDPNGQWAGVDEVAGAAIGATVGTLSYLAGHLIKYKSFRCVTRAEIAVVFGVGFVAGFFATDTFGGSVAVAATSNVVQYAGVQVVNWQEITGTGLVSNGIAGALGGVGSQALKGAEANTIENIARGPSRINYPSSKIDIAINESGQNLATGFIGNADPDCGCN
jgi:uncharacterized protein RhaS with RHS repeats